jgi:hypothetical protein
MVLPTGEGDDMETKIEATLVGQGFVPAYAFTEGFGPGDDGRASFDVTLTEGWGTATYRCETEWDGQEYILTDRSAARLSIADSLWPVLRAAIVAATEAAI